jgi:hypothetical protein
LEPVVQRIERCGSSIFRRADPSRKHLKNNIRRLDPDVLVCGALIGLRADPANSGAFDPQRLLSEAFPPL